MVGKIILWVFLSLLGLAILLLLVPAVAQVDWREGVLKLKVRILGIPLTLYPRKEKPEKEKKPKKERRFHLFKRKKKKGKEEGEQEKEKKKRTPEELLQLAKRLLTSISAGGKFILRHMRVYDVELVIPVNTGDAADTAILYGRLQGLLGAVRALLENFLRIAYKRLELVPDFAGQFAGTSIFSCKVSASPVIMLAAGVIGFRRFLDSKPQRVQPAARPPTPPPTSMQNSAAPSGPKRSETHAEQ